MPLKVSLRLAVLLSFLNHDAWLQGLTISVPLFLDDFSPEISTDISTSSVSTCRL